MHLSDPIVQRLRDLAKEASTRAYAPYSGFPVGAAVLTHDGATFAAANVENASYSLTMCAERNAVFQAVSSGHLRIRAIAIFTPTARPCTPCGACRQVLAEFGPDAHVFGFADGETSIQTTIRELLPHPFGPADPAS